VFSQNEKSVLGGKGIHLKMIALRLACMVGSAPVAFSSIIEEIMISALNLSAPQRLWLAGVYWHVLGRCH
jgi:hypothetical protein